MLRKLIIACAAGLVAMSGASAAPPTTFVFNVPYVDAFDVSCDGVHVVERIDVEGTLQVVQQLVQTPSGAVIVSNQTSAQGLTGVGETSGTSYRCSLEQHEGSAFDHASEGTVVGNFRFIAPGRDENFLVHVTIHFTFDADGNLKADVDHVSFTCH